MPAATRAIIGGSGSQAADFPGDLHPGARVVERDLVFATPWGDSPPFTLFELDGLRALHTRMHGWRPGVSRGRASRQVFSVLHRAGVRRILWTPAWAASTTCWTLATSWSWTTSWTSPRTATATASSPAVTC